MIVFGHRNGFETFWIFIGVPRCRGGRTADAMGWLKRGVGSRALVGSRGKVGMSERGTQDIPRFGALRRDNTPSPAECGLYVTVQSCSSSCMEEQGGQARA